jgi:hypothetical protein
MHGARSAGIGRWKVTFMTGIKLESIPLRSIQRADDRSNLCRRLPSPEALD